MKNDTNWKVRSMSIFSLIAFLNLQFLPTYTLALGNGTRQPEYDAYESSSSVDMVNLSTGNLAYTIPLVNVPGPEGGFSMPLSYHSGIRHGQESSWVGLGWSLNPGAITRDVAVFPDDYVGEQLLNEVHDDGGRQYFLNVLGFYQGYKDTEGGRGGSVGIGNVFRVGFGNQRGFTALGINYNSTLQQGDQWTFDIYEIASSITSAYQLGASIASGSYSSLSAVGKSFVKSVVGAAAMQGIMHGMNSPGVNQVATVNDYVRVQDRENSDFFTKEYVYYLDLQNDIHVLGGLYLGETDNSSHHSQDYTKTWNAVNAGHKLKKGTNAVENIKSYKNDNTFGSTVSDMTMKDGSQSDNAAHVAYDSYNVKGPGISGSIMPLRKEIGSLSGNSGDDHTYFITSPFLKTKAQFVYNDNSNYYDHHTGALDAVNNLNQPGGVLSHARNSNNFLITTVQLNDDYLHETNDRIDSRSDGSMINDKLVKGNHVEWYTNAEIAAGTAGQNGFVESPSFIVGSTSTRNMLPQNGIGGYSITAADGTTYHYAYPIYNRYQKSKSISTADANDYSSTENTNKFATGWLLTAITGADYIDVNNDGLVNDGDWGYWVEMEYGHFSSHFEWRYPFENYSMSEDGAYKTFVHGTRENVYLNRISTRSHTALFVKEIKSDGKGYYDPVNGSPVFGVTEAGSTLKLKEIITLKNEDYATLTTHTGHGGYGLSNTLGNSSVPSGLVNSSTNFSQVLDNYDMEALSQTATDFVSEKQINKVVFNTDYSLAPNTVNSYDDISADPKTFKGRLTLTGISTYGTNDLKTTPDMTFGYSNPTFSYSEHAWDGWQFPTSTARTSAYADHKVGPSDPIYWHLGNIDFGGVSETTINYQRDSYSSISGDKIGLEIKQDADLANMYLIETHGTPFEDSYAVGDVVDNYQIVVDGVNFFADFTVSSVSQDRLYYSNIVLRNSSGTVISNTTGSSLETVLPDNPNNLPPTIPVGPTTLTTKKYYRSYNKKGGDVRVSQITLTDPVSFEKHRTKYRYTLDGTDSGLSSGVCSVEPEHIRSVDYDYYEYNGYGPMPILYRKVTVLSGFQDNGDALNKKVYRFITPHRNFVVAKSQTNQDYNPEGISGARHKVKNHVFEMNTSRIGQLKSIATYTNHDELMEEASFEYFSNAELAAHDDIGKYTTGATVCSNGFVNGVENTFFTRTTSVHYPTIPKAVVFDGVNGSKRIENTSFDLLTGTVLKTEYLDSWGTRYETENVPAYHEYSEMGSKLASSTNRHMMSQSAGEYLYVYDQNGSKKPVSASATTWNDNWTYRELSTTGSNSEYVDNSYTNEVYRKHKTYEWKSELNGDGSYSTFTAFDYGPSANNLGWEKISEVTTYDHFSHPLEVLNINGFGASSKYDVTGYYKLIAASRAKYSDIAFTGLELPAVNYLLSDGVWYNNTDAILSTDQAHTGTQSLKIEGSVGIQAEIELNTDNYVVNTWVHSTNLNNAKLVADLYLGSSTTALHSIQLNSSNAQVLKAGDWYLLSMDIPTSVYPTATRMIVSVQNSNPNSNTPIYADDFKCSPLESKASCVVYDPSTQQVIAALNADHLARTFEYDDAGVVKSIKQEVGDHSDYTGGFKTVEEHFYNYGKTN